MVGSFKRGSKVTKNSELGLLSKKESKIIKLIFAFFSISLLLFGGNTFMISYSQPQQIPSQVNQQTQKQEEEHELLYKLQKLQQQAKVPAITEEGESAANISGATENTSGAFTYQSDVPSIIDLRKIQTETLPGSPLRAKLLQGTGSLGAAIENLTSSGNMTAAIENLTSSGNMTAAITGNMTATTTGNMTATTTGNMTATTTGNMTATINAPHPNPPGAEPVPDTVGQWSGCDPGYLGRVHPEWVPVRPSPNSPPWTEPVVAEGTIYPSGHMLSYEEWPFSHKSHDNHIFVHLDPAYNNLPSTASAYNEDDGKWTMKMEWEIGSTNTGITDRFPKEFWPWVGDTVWMKGEWVVDCGHPTIDASGAHGYKTEIHPPFITAFTRNEPYRFGDEGGDAYSASSAEVSYIYIHGRGGYFGGPHGTGGTHDTPVGGQNYEFDVPTLPKPGSQFQLRYKVVSLPFGGPAPTLTEKPGENLAHVVVPLSGVPASPDLHYGAIVASKWFSPSVHPTEVFRTLKVTFDSIHINKDHDDLTAEWNNLWAGVNGRWIELSGPLGHYGLDSADDAFTYTFPTSEKYVYVKVPENGELRIKTTGWESDDDKFFGREEPPTCVPPYDIECAEAADVNEPIGYVEKVWTKATNFGTGEGPPALPPEQHEFSRTAEGDSETNGDFVLNYHIEQFPPQQPQYVHVPYLECYDWYEAKDELEDNHLHLTTPYAPGIAFSQSPQGGTLVQTGTGVGISLHSGPCP